MPQTIRTVRWHQYCTTKPPEGIIVLVWFPPHDTDLKAHDQPDMFPAIADYDRNQWQHPEGGVVEDMHPQDRWITFEMLAQIPVEE